MSFELARALRRIRPQRRSRPLARRDDKSLPFAPAGSDDSRPLLLDTCVYIDVLRGTTPAAIDLLLTKRLAHHSTVCLGELTCLFGRLDPHHPSTAEALRRTEAALGRIPSHRLIAPSQACVGEAGMLAGLLARLTGEPPDRIARANDAQLYLQAIENGWTLLTRNIRDFDFLDQLLPASRLLLYREAA